MLVRAAAVQQHERALGRARRGAHDVREGVGQCRRSRRVPRVRQRCRAAAPGARAGARAAAAAAAPSRASATGSSTVKPMSREASSKRTPLGSRKYTEWKYWRSMIGVAWAPAAPPRRATPRAQRRRRPTRRRGGSSRRPGMPRRRRAGGRSRGGRGARRRRGASGPVVGALAAEARAPSSSSPLRSGSGRVGAHAVEALERVLVRDVRRVRGERRVVAAGDVQLVGEPLGVAEQQHVAVAGGRDLGVARRASPEVDRLGGADAPADRVHHPVAGAPGRGAGELEEREDRAGRADLVAVVEVVDARARRS